MNSFLDKIKKASSLIEVRKLESLNLRELYPVVKFVRVETRYGKTVQAYLQEAMEDGQKLDGEEGEMFRVYLPNRIASEISDQDIAKYNNNPDAPLSLIYRGKIGLAHDIDFV